MFREAFVLSGILAWAALPVRAELDPLFHWQSDETRTSLQLDGRLYRNCGRNLEAWDLSVDPPVQEAVLEMASPPVDLLDWDGLLLVLCGDGTVRALDPADIAQAPLWRVDTGTCARQLLRAGTRLLPIAPRETRVVELADPSSPVLLDEPLGGGQWSARRAGLHGGQLLGLGASESCDDDVAYQDQANHAPLGPDGLGSAAGVTGSESSWSWGDLCHVDGGWLLGGSHQLALLDEVGWTVDATLNQESWLPQTRLLEQDGAIWVSRWDRLQQLDVELDPAAVLDVAGEWPLAGGWGIQPVDGALLLTAQEGNRWVDLPEVEESRFLPAPGEVQAMAFGLDRVFVAQRTLKALQWQVDRLVECGETPLDGECDLLASDGEIVLAANRDGVSVYHWPAGQPAAELAATLPYDFPQFLHVRGTLGLILADNTLRLVDLSVPGQPEEITALAIDGALDAVVNNDLIAVRDMEGATRFYRIDEGLPLVADLFSPFEKMFFCGDLFVTARYNQCLYISTFQITDGMPVQLTDQCVGEYYFMPGGAAVSDRLYLNLLPLFPEDPGSVCELTAFAWGTNGWEPVGSAPAYMDEEMWASLSPGFPDWLATRVAGDGIRFLGTEPLLAVEPEVAKPVAFSLSAAPNPFNPLTRLSFTLELAGHARLAVFDLLGREVALPLDEELAAGVHDIAFDASALASGVYIARLEADGQSTVTKLALLR